ncbi:M23 family metallopeptidase [Sphingomonas parva]|uniref:M23 family metallopeptidase n=1 Tax=Sphingomonas parva TaxID=2555898 RepID=A0A4Y8ZRV0_9SPHN|nr:M23 family metallopeptidase [Sphingomonas parva]TFI58760.1 M23 family metallopeptidase [Sphingomonas parva]
MYQFTNFTAGGAGSGAAVLSADPLSLRTGAPFGSRRAAPQARRRVELVVDLGASIGSLTWFRGLATCLGLCAAAISLAPGFEPIPSASAAPLSDQHWEQARALAISPLAYGADTGRRMAPTDAVQPLMDTPERPTLELIATLGQGDGFARALTRAGVSGAEASAVADLVGGVVPLDSLKPGSAMQIVLGRRPNRSVARPLESLSFRARFDLALSLTRSGAGFAVSRTAIAVDETPLRIQGVVGDSLYRAARAAGAPAKAVEAYIRALAAQTEISSLGASDRFDIILEHRRAETGETQTGQLLFAGLQRASGKELQLLQWEQGGRSQWFEASGVGRTTGTLQRPVPGSVSSNYGMRRHPILGYSRMHRGMDFRAGYGTPILAATDGRVVSAGWAGGHGRRVMLAHADGISTSYSHMSQISVRPGSAVRQGQVIGYVGSTGLSTGPHLHYELYRNGVSVNPASVRFVSRSQLSGADLAGFRAKLRRLLSVPVGGAIRMAEAPKPAKPL